MGDNERKKMKSLLRTISEETSKDFDIKMKHLVHKLYKAGVKGEKKYLGYFFLLMTSFGATPSFFLHLETEVDGGNHLDQHMMRLPYYEL